MNDERKSSEGLRRALTNRQIQMMAVGGVLGVGLFYGSALAVKLSGPGVLLDFVLCGIIAAIVMRALGEMTVENPVSGSFRQYAHEQLGPGIGFVTGAMWWFYWTATVMSELAAIGKLIEYWFPAFPAFAPGLIALILFTLSNLLAVQIFGELEYWFAILKVFTVAIFMIFGVLLVTTGLFEGGHAVWFSNLFIHGGFLPHGWVGVLAAMSLVVQAYSGIETLAVESAESKNPGKLMTRAFRTVTFRIVFIYIGSIFVMLLAFPWTYIVSHTGSPYAMLFSRIGIPLAAGVVNLLIIMSGLSSCNTGLYGGSRMLFSMARDRDLPALASSLNKNKVPHIAVWITALMISVGILVTYLAPNSVYVWITSASAFASLWTWGVILVSELRFRKRANQGGRLLQYAMPWWPTLPILGLVLLAVALYAIVTSPLTQISVFSGLIFLVLAWLYYWFRLRKRDFAK